MPPAIKKKYGVVMKMKQLGACMLAGLMTTSCINTVLEIKMEQWVQCWSSCGKQDNPEAAGLDWWSGEQTCLCKTDAYGRRVFKRIRLEPEERMKSWDYEAETQYE